MNLLKEETYKSKYIVEVQNIYERLCIEETEQHPYNGSFNNQCDQKWTTVKQSIKSSLNAVLPRKANRKKQKWMTDDILNLMENRKQFKNSDKDEYNRLNKQINLACKEAKEKWLVNQCEEVEQLEKQYKSREMHNKVKELTSNRKKQKWMTDDILNLMENRKQFKNSDKDEYNRLNKQINLACKEAKEKWLVNQCEEVEQLEKQYLQIISKLYWEQSACVRTESGMTSEFKIKKGVRQGCVLSPNLFNLYTEKILREVEDMK